VFCLVKVVGTYLKRLTASDHLGKLDTRKEQKKIFHTDELLIQFSKLMSV